MFFLFFILITNISVSKFGYVSFKTSLGSISINGCSTCMRVKIVFGVFSQCVVYPCTPDNLVKHGFCYLYFPGHKTISKKLGKINC